MRFFPRKLRYKILLGFALLLVIASVSLVLILQSDWFYEKVRTRVVSELERITGGRAELGAFHFDWKTMQASVKGLVLHGTEPAGVPPLLSIESADLKIHVLSVIDRKVDLRTLQLAGLRVRIAVDENGRTNFPGPRVRKSDKTWVEQVLNIGIKEYSIQDGLIEYDSRKTPVNIRGENLRLRMTYEAAGPRYRGDLSSRVHMLDRVFDTEADFSLERERVHVTQANISSPGLKLAARGVLEDLRSPRGTFDVNATAGLRELAGISGNGAFKGRAELSWRDAFTYEIRGVGAARGLRFDPVTVNSAEAQVHLKQGRLELTGITARALDSTFSGQATLENLFAKEGSRFQASGKIADLSMRAAARLRSERTPPWDGILSGPVEVAGVIQGKRVRGVNVRAGVTITPAPSRDAAPLEGQLAVNWDQAKGSIALGNSYLATPHTRIDMVGTLGETLQVRARSSDLSDLAPLLEGGKLPVTLNGGHATVTGVASGPLDDVKFAGQASLTQFSYENHPIDQFSAEIELSKTNVSLRRISAARGALRVDGQADIALAEWKTAGPIQANLNARGADLAKLAPEFGLTTPVSGIAAASAKISGELKNPTAEIGVQVEKPGAYGETFERLRADIRYSPTAVEVLNAELDPPVSFRGAYQHREGDWKNGELKFEASTPGLALERIGVVAEYDKTIAGTVTGKASGALRVVNSVAEIVTLDASFTGRGLSYRKRPLGELSATAETRGSDLNLRAGLKIQDLNLEAAGSVRLTGDQEGQVEIKSSRVTWATLRQVLGLNDRPFSAYMDASATVRFAIRKPEALRAEIRIPTIEVQPLPGQELRLGAQIKDMTLRNTKPITLQVTRKEVRLGDVEFAAKNTNLAASGTVALDAKTTAELSVTGSVDLAILQVFNKDLLARGVATVKSSIRGTLQDPQMAGTMELKGASLYLADFPNGVDNANGRVQFDRRRATIERLSAETGGGMLNFTGFVEFGNVLVYRMQASATQVRVRYPEDVSVTMNANLNLTGTSENSVVSGVVTLLRASFNPKTDLGDMLAQTAKPVPTPATPNEYLRGMQLDVRIETGAGLEVQTTLTRDLQAEADLRLKGTPLRPILQGSVSVVEGEVQVFGNRYTINRGDVRFLNQIKIEPEFDMDLETRARGITVNVSFSGTLQKLNASYRSDPPLQTSEIIALLAVGRDPTSSAGAASAQTTQASFLQTGGSSLLGQALNAQVTSRVQRFFGVSKLKIDPTITGVENLPQARLTIEQQVSKDITLTYITNLNRTQEQVVRLQWDLSKQWSLLAVREGSGVFGLDFQYRKRFK